MKMNELHPWGVLGIACASLKGQLPSVPGGNTQSHDTDACVHLHDTALCLGSGPEKAPRAGLDAVRRNSERREPGLGPVLRAPSQGVSARPPEPGFPPLRIPP